jgi:hypothetical protein
LGFRPNADNTAVTYNDGQYKITIVGAPADLKAVKTAAKGVDPTATVTVDATFGVMTVKLSGQTFRLMPDYAITIPPADKVGQAFWVDSFGRVVVRNTDGTAQAFTVR